MRLITVRVIVIAPTGTMAPRDEEEVPMAASPVNAAAAAAAPTPSVLNTSERTKM